MSTPRSWLPYSTIILKKSARLNWYWARALGMMARE
jgi:hypothetical protein